MPDKKQSEQQHPCWGSLCTLVMVSALAVGALQVCQSRACAPLQFFQKHLPHLPEAGALPAGPQAGSWRLRAAGARSAGMALSSPSSPNRLQRVDDVWSE